MEKISLSQAKALWIHAQGLDVAAPFGKGPAATPKAIEHLGYVQIDTISVIERCHHHILFSRIPDYKRDHLRQAQTVDRTVFEYWTHALAYVPAKDFRFFMRDMKRRKGDSGPWFQAVTPKDLKRILNLIKRDGAISIRDIKDDVLVEKDHDWASRKPSKRVLQLGFNAGLLTISERQGMLKKYELIERHFDWKKKPVPASEKEIVDYVVNRALRSQSLVSLDSICHLNAKAKPAVRKYLEIRVKKGELVPVAFPEAGKTELWMPVEDLKCKIKIDSDRVHILSPFDPLIIQRKRLKMFFGYEHLFEAYVPPAKRKMGYFTLPVLVGDQIVAGLDLKTDRAAGRLLIQKWNWIGKSKSAANRKIIEKELDRFEKFQLAKEI